MALIYDSRLRAISSSGAILVGATLTIYTAGTTTPAAIWRDAALTVAMTNPVSGIDASDAGGWFPQIFAAEALLLDITLKTSAGVTVQTYVSVPSLGTGTAIILRDFGNSRARIAGSGGIVRYEGGPPTGDDTGGQVTLGGYNGTQADAAVIDAVTVNTTGILTENSKAIEGVVVTPSTAFTAVGSLAIALATTSLNECEWEVNLNQLTTSAPMTLSITFSFDNGATYAATNYTWAVVIFEALTVTTGSGVASDLRPSFSATGGFLTLRVHTAGTTVSQTGYYGELASSYRPDYIVSGGHTTGGLRATHMKITTSTGTITGRYSVVAKRWAV